MSRNRDRSGQFALALTVNAAVFGGLGILGMALSPLPTTLIRDLTSPPAAHAPVPTRPLSVLPGMGSGLELVRVPRGLDVHTVPWSAGAAHRPVHLNFGEVDHVGRHRAPADQFHQGGQLRHPSRTGVGSRPMGHHHVGDGADRGCQHGHRADHHVRQGGRHHRSDGHVGGHHQGSHSHGGHHAEHGGGAHRGL